MERYQVLSWTVSIGTVGHDGRPSFVPIYGTDGYEIMDETIKIHIVDPDSAVVIALAREIKR